jgi:hypothetical protein
MSMNWTTLSEARADLDPLVRNKTLEFLKPIDIVELEENYHDYYA